MRLRPGPKTSCRRALRPKRRLAAGRGLSATACGRRRRRTPAKLCSAAHSQQTLLCRTFTTDLLCRDMCTTEPALLRMHNRPALLRMCGRANPGGTGRRTEASDEQRAGGHAAIDPQVRKAMRSSIGQGGGRRGRGWPSQLRRRVSDGFRRCRGSAAPTRPGPSSSRRARSRV